MKMDKNKLSPMTPAMLACGTLAGLYGLAVSLGWVFNISTLGLGVLLALLFSLAFHYAMKSREARLRGVMDNVVDSIFTIGEEGIIESFNPAAERIFGYPASEVTGKNLTFPSPYQSC